MPDLLLELYSEEIPAFMQRPAAENLKKQVEEALAEKKLAYAHAHIYWTPRRLVLHISNLSEKSPDRQETRKGPAITAPPAAVAGFLRAGGLTSLDQATILTDPKKGAYYSAAITHKGRAARDILAEILPEIIRNFSWPKSMRWGADSAREGALRWVRPLHSVLCVLSTDTQSDIVEFNVGSIKSGRATFGHPFMYGRKPINVRNFDDYAARLTKAKVVLDAGRRKEIILADARNLCFARGLELVEDERLAEEVAGLVEWPVVLSGTFAERFLAIPPEIIRLTIKTNQKCFVTRLMPAAKTAAGQIEKMAGPHEHHDKKLANYFILTANIEPKDKGEEIIKGNGKVVQARLADALYFWQTDQKSLPDLPLLRQSAEKFALDMHKPLDQRMAQLDYLNVTFHAKLGTQGARVARIMALAAKIAPLTGAESKAARRAAALAKADLQTEIVGEFPEMQGLAGHKYALLQGENAAIAAAIEEHYKPQGPKDNVPRNPVSVAVALADKIDILVGFWLINEKPTGSKDPYALRRAALGVIRLVLAQDRPLHLLPLFREAAHLLHISIVEQHMQNFAGSKISAATGQNGAALRPAEEEKHFEEQLIAGADAALRDLLGFFHERFKVWLREQGARHDAIEAVLTAQSDDLRQTARKIEAVIAFIGSTNGAALLNGAKRALNILAAEAGKKTQIAAQVDPVEFTAKEETALYDAVFQTEKKLQALPAEDNFSDALAALAELRAPIDAFFEKVLVNDENTTRRANRLAILARIRNLLTPLADFSRLNG
ncbi:glycine--tRNA ligase subunit beta [Candidatus Tokpelaia sp.]|uniref:glycine--tRNA ligase subunit beta n=1 Tax=Candidatus Tokpelaia sp. TaxID=2233777 RepID=UPI00123AC692|nr:glycine--tRNA ligase subunit beta [Candidatus Tokpelaia sp.]KAA6405302.1 glycine--tRNA ligase subunit beta [Candidatus Tokpelaia sp.]